MPTGFPVRSLLFVTCVMTLAASGCTSSGGGSIPAIHDGSGRTDLVSIDIVTPAATAYPGESFSFFALGTYEDRSVADLTQEVTWISTDEGVAVTQPGAQALAVAPGSTIIVAELEGFVSNTLPVEVLAPDVVSVSVTVSASSIAVGQSAQLEARATLSDGSDIDVSGTAEWSVSDETVAQVIPIAPVLIVGHAVGSVEVTATAGSVISDAVTVTVTAPEVVSLALEGGDTEIEPGQTTELVVTAELSDGTELDVTDAVDWVNDNPAVIEITEGSPALATALAVGDAEVAATTGGVTSNVLSFEVTEFVLIGLFLSGPTQPLTVGESGELTVIGVYSDGQTETGEDVTDQVTWNLGVPGIVDIVPGSPATVTGIAPGAVTITATLETITSDGVDVTVVDGSTDPLVFMNGGGPEVVVSGVTFEADTDYDGSNFGFTAGNTHIDAVPIADTEDDALYQSHRFGTFGFRAAAPNGGYEIVLHFAEIFAPFGNGDRVFDVTIEGELVEDDLDVHAVAGPATALVRTHLVEVMDGLLEIDFEASQNYAMISGIAVTFLGDLPDPEVVGLEIVPADTSVSVGGTKSFTAVAQFDVGPDSVVTSDAQWTSSDSGVAASSSDPWVFEGIAEGVATITASYQGFSADAQLTVTDSTGEEVAKYDTAEISLEAGTSYDGNSGSPNPFNDVSLAATVTSPSGATFEVEGFFDGDGDGGAVGEIFKLRICPNEEGTWSWTTSSNVAGLDGESGSFDCSGTLPGLFGNGAVVRNPQYPRTFMQQEGQPLFLIGKFLDAAAPTPLRYCHTLLSEAHSTSQRQQIFDRHVGFDVNKMNLYLANYGDYYGGDYPTTPWVGTAGNDDKTRFDLARWKMYDEWTRTLRDAGMVAHFWFFADDSGYGNLSDAHRMRLIEYGMKRLSGYSNTMWILCLEWQEGWSTSEVASHMEFMHSKNPWNRELSVHGHTGLFSFPDEPWADYLDIQYSQSASHPDTYNLTISNRDLAEKPVIAEEFWPGQETSPGRQKAWAAVLAGSASIGNGADLEHVAAFAESGNFPFEKMAPDNSLVVTGSAYALAEPGVHYILYLYDGGSVTVDLGAMSGMKTAQWFDPRTGVFSSGQSVNGGGNVTLTAPGADDWVLQIY